MLDAVPTGSTGPSECGAECEHVGRPSGHDEQFVHKPPSLPRELGLPNLLAEAAHSEGYSDACQDQRSPQGRPVPIIVPVPANLPALAGLSIAEMQEESASDITLLGRRSAIVRRSGSARAASTNGPGRSRRVCPG